MPAVSVTNYNTAIQNCTDAIEAANWAEAWEQLAVAQGLLGGLAESANAEGTAFKLGQLQLLRETLDRAQTEANRSADNQRRMIRSRVQHGY